MPVSSLWWAAKRSIRAILYGLNIAIVVITVTNWAMDHVLGGKADLNLAHQFIQYSGAITIDPAANKILYIHDDQRNANYLPMVPKRAYESSQGAAQRAVLDRLDLIVCQYSLPFSSFAMEGYVRDGAKQENEPFALVQDTNEKNEDGEELRRMIYWYITNADSTAIPLNHDSYTPQRRPNEVAVWADYGTALEALSLPIEVDIMRRALQIFRAYAVTKGKAGTKDDVCVPSAMQAKNKEGVEKGLGKAMADAMIAGALGEAWMEVFGDKGREDAINEAYAGAVPSGDASRDRVTFPQFM